MTREVSVVDYRMVLVSRRNVVVVAIPVSIFKLHKGPEFSSDLAYSRSYSWGVSVSGYLFPEEPKWLTDGIDD